MTRKNHFFFKERFDCFVKLFVETLFLLAVVDDFDVFVFVVFLYSLDNVLLLSSFLE